MENINVMTCKNFCEAMRKMAATMVRGCRNIEEQAAIIALQYKKENGTGSKSARCVRVVGKELGTHRYSDYREVLDIVHIVKETEKLYIGSAGERVKKDSVVFFEQDVK
jgi:hypothetical protein